MAHFSLIVFLLSLAFGSILFIVDIIYTSKTNDALNAGDLASAKSNFQVASGFTYFFCAIALLGALTGALASGAAAGEALHSK